MLSHRVGPIHGFVVLHNISSSTLSLGCLLLLLLVLQHRIYIDTTHVCDDGIVHVGRPHRRRPAAVREARPRPTPLFEQIAQVRSLDYHTLGHLCVFVCVVATQSGVNVCGLLACGRVTPPPPSFMYLDSWTACDSTPKPSV